MNYKLVAESFQEHNLINKDLNESWQNRYKYYEKLDKTDIEAVKDFIRKINEFTSWSGKVLYTDPRFEAYIKKFALKQLVIAIEKAKNAKFDGKFIFKEKEYKGSNDWIIDFI